MPCRTKKISNCRVRKENFRQKEVDTLLEKFEEDLKPLGVTCKNWAKLAQVVRSIN